MSNAPSSSSDVPTLGPSASSGPSYGSSFSPSFQDESSFPSLAPSSETFDQNESSFTPSAGPSVYDTDEPSFPTNTTNATQTPSLGSSSPEQCTIPDLQCQEMFQSRYPGFFMGGLLTCDDPLRVSLPMYFEGCEYYRGMSCPSCLMICEDGYPVTSIPLVACCAEACVASCGYLSCNLP